MDLFGPHKSSQFPSWDEIRPLMEGRLDEEEEVLLLERIRNSDTSDPARQALKGLLERSNYDTSALKKSNLRLRNKISIAYNSSSRSLPLKKLAAIFILAVGVTSVIYFMNSSSDFSDAYIHDPGFPVYMSGESHPYNWMEAYRAGNFEHALEEILKHPDFGISDTLRYYASIIYYEKNDNLKSLLLLNSIVDSALIDKTYLLKSFNFYELGYLDSAQIQLEFLFKLNVPESRSASFYIKEYFSN
jgi:hypothetical protein